MKQLETIVALREFIHAQKREAKRVAFVPTMGALHEGHRSCFDVARDHGDVLAVSIFVNPTQFGPGEDVERYPVDLDRDLDLCRSWGCDVVFTPTADEMYPEAQTTWIEVGALAEPLCGCSRPGHFRGVATVVAKLFHAVEPDVAVFGQKDAQQALVIRAMVQQLGFPIVLQLSPIVRDPDGLALSSRNVNLSADERARALGLSRGLEVGRQALEAGESSPEAVCEKVRELMTASGLDGIEYVELLDAATLRPLARMRGKMILAAAVRVGATRLIDNMVVEIHGDGTVDEALLF